MRPKQVLRMPECMKNGKAQFGEFDLVECLNKRKCANKVSGQIQDKTFCSQGLTETIFKKEK